MNVFEFLKPPKKSGGPAAQISDMQASLEKLRADRADVQKIVDGHESKRALMLLSAATEEAILDLDRQCDLARLRLERAGLAEFELESRIESARDTADRQRRAAENERAAGAIEEKVKAADAAVVALAGAFADLVRIIPPDAGILIDQNGFAPNRAATPAELAAAFVGQGLFACAPSLFETRVWHGRILRRLGVERRLAVRVLDAHGLLVDFLPGAHGEEVDVLPASLAAQQILVDPLRAQAAELRASDGEKVAAK